MKDLGYQPTSAYEGWNLPLISQISQEQEVSEEALGELTILPAGGRMEWETESSRLENTFQIIMSNHQFDLLSSTTKPHISVPYPHISSIPPGMGSPSHPCAACSNAWPTSVWRLRHKKIQIYSLTIHPPGQRALVLCPILGKFLCTFHLMNWMKHKATQGAASTTSQFQGRSYCPVLQP